MLPPAASVHTSAIITQRFFGPLMNLKITTQHQFMVLMNVLLTCS